MASAVGNINQSIATQAPTNVDKTLQTGKTTTGLQVTAENDAKPLLSAQGADAEEIAMKLGNRANRDLKVKSKKMDDTAQSKKTGRATENQADEANFAEEKSALMRLLKKFSAKENISDDEQKELLDELSDEEKRQLLEGFSGDLNHAGKQLLDKTVGLLKKEGRDGIHSSKIRQLERQLETSQGSVDQKFWKDLHDLTELTQAPSGEVAKNAEASRDFLDSPIKLLKSMDKRFPESELKLVVVVEVKKLGYVLGQSANNNRSGLLAICKELNAAKTLMALIEETEIVEHQIERWKVGSDQPSMETS
ncbi:hypothetical protein [Candidatus Sororendozoicomonas aggregata]|uniref:hypothetical protein n=1 Tax=Candidatus Sororendozoicomonas aggregata TaxID=3073239 RepID=UPI002ED1CB43